MKVFDKVDMKPPYDIGGKIWDKIEDSSIFFYFSVDIIGLMLYIIYVNGR